MFLQNIIFNNQPWYNIFIMSSLFVYSQYIFFDFFFKNYNKKYNTLNPNVQDYIVSNISKSVILLLICIVSSKIIILLFHDIWPENVWKNVVAVYISTDFVSLIVVRKHKINTLIHHIFSVLMGIMAILFIDFNEKNIWKLILLYGIFSATVYTINLFLGMRFLFDKKSKNMKLLCTSSCYFYIGVCSFNWIFQIYFIFNWELYLFGWQFLLYITAICSFIKDDIKLIQFMLNY